MFENTPEKKPGKSKVKGFLKGSALGLLALGSVNAADDVKNQPSNTPTQQEQTQESKINKLDKIKSEKYGNLFFLENFPKRDDLYVLTDGEKIYYSPINSEKGEAENPIDITHSNLGKRMLDKHEIYKFNHKTRYIKAEKGSEEPFVYDINYIIDDFENNENIFKFDLESTDFDVNEKIKSISLIETFPIDKNGNPVPGATRREIPLNEINIKVNENNGFTGHYTLPKDSTNGKIEIEVKTDESAEGRISITGYIDMTTRGAIDSSIVHGKVDIN